MKKLLSLLLVCALLSPVGLFAQSSNEQMLKDWERAKAFTKEYLEAMPEDGYAFKPTKEMRSFAQQMLHLADANYGLGALAAGTTSPIGRGAAEKSTDQSKAATMKMVLDSYDFVINAIKNTAADKMGESFDAFGNKITREVGFMKTFEHQTHHRGQATVYIRLKGATPPGEKLF